MRALCLMFDARGDGTKVNYVAFLKFIKHPKLLAFVEKTESFHIVVLANWVLKDLNNKHFFVKDNALDPCEAFALCDLVHGGSWWWNSGAYTKLMPTGSCL